MCQFTIHLLFSLLGFDGLVFVVEALDDFVGNIHGGVHVEGGAIDEGLAEDDVELLVVGVVFADEGEDAVEEFDVGVHLLLHNLVGELGFEGAEFFGTLFEFGFLGLLLGECHGLAGLDEVLVVFLEVGHLLLIAAFLSFFVFVELFLQVDSILVFGEECVAIDVGYFEAVFGDDGGGGIGVVLAGGSDSGEMEDVEGDEAEKEDDVAGKEALVAVAFAFFAFFGLVSAAVFWGVGRLRLRSVLRGEGLGLFRCVGGGVVFFDRVVLWLVDFHVVFSFYLF